MRGRDQHGSGAGAGECRHVDALGVHGYADDGEAVAAQQAPLGRAGRVLDGEQRVAAAARACTISAMPCATPPTTTMRSGEALAARTRPRYAASAVRSSGTPPGSPYDSLLCGTVASAYRVAASQAARGKADMSEVPGLRS